MRTKSQNISKHLQTAVKEENLTFRSKLAPFLSQAELTYSVLLRSFSRILSNQISSNPGSKIIDHIHVKSTKRTK